MNLELILKDSKKKLLKSLDHLEYSYKKVEKIPYNTQDLEELETWESFMARFSRSTDMFISKYLRSKVMYEEPGFMGSLRGFLNKAEKLHLIEKASQWINIREIRSLKEDEYTEENLPNIFKSAFIETPAVLNVRKTL